MTSRGKQRGKGRADRQAAARARDELNLRLTKAGPAPDGKGFDFEFKAETRYVQAVACVMVAFFDGEGATNYVEFQISHKKRGAFVFCLQRKLGKTPHELRVEAEKQRDAYRKALEDTRARLRGTRWEMRDECAVEAAPGVNWPFVTAAIGGIDAALHEVSR